MNSFGSLFRLTTFGESHGTAVGGIVDGCPAGMKVDFAAVDADLLRRRKGDTLSKETEKSSLLTQRSEPDVVEWLSGIHEGRTLGTSVAFLVRNRDCRPEDYEALRDCFRPGHADYTYEQKYGIRDYRGGGRASGRETVARVVAGSLAKQVLDRKGITVSARVEGDWIACTATGLPAGVGEPVFDRLNARLAYAMLSIPSALSFAMGSNPDDWRRSSGQFPDAWVEQGSGERLTVTNHCGGVQGGISNGMPVVFHVGFHLPPTQAEGMLCRNREGNLVHVVPGGRHDIDHRHRLPVIVESMAAITILDLILQNKKNELADAVLKN